MSNPAGGARAESGGEGASSFLPTPHIAPVTETAELLLPSHLGVFTGAEDTEV